MFISYALDHKSIKKNIGYSNLTEKKISARIKLIIINTVFLLVVKLNTTDKLWMGV